MSAPTTMDPPSSAEGPARRLRLDDPRITGRLSARNLPTLAWIVLAGGFVLLWAGNLDLGPRAARLGMAASEGRGPLGQALGGWDPSLWPARVAISQVWAWGEGGRASSASVRWPEAIAALVIGLIVSRRLAGTAGARAGVLAALTLFGSLAMIHRAEGLGLDLIAGMAVVAALDRILSRSADLVSGVWASLAFLAGGWPPVALIALPIIIVGRSGHTLSLRFLAPLTATVAAWCFWTVQAASPEVLAAALALPLKQPPAWWLAPGALLLGLPWTPFAALAALPSARQGWSDETRTLVKQWVQVGLVALLAGTLLPGLAPSARVVVVGVQALLAAVVLERLVHGDLPRATRRLALGLVLGLVAVAAVVTVPVGGYIAAAIPYYRQIAFVLIGLALAALALGFAGARRGRPGLALAALVVLAVGLKLGHGCVYVPEWNYRLSQGPWGRALGQWVPPNTPLYVVHAWPDDLLFHTERPARQLPAPDLLNFKPKNESHYVLLLPSEYDHWPAHAPRIEKIRDFEDPRGGTRVLVQTVPLSPDAAETEAEADANSNAAQRAPRDSFSS